MNDFEVMKKKKQHYNALISQISTLQESNKQNLFKIGSATIVISIWITFPNQVFHR